MNGSNLFLNNHVERAPYKAGGARLTASDVGLLFRRVSKSVQVRDDTTNRVPRILPEHLR